MTTRVATVLSARDWEPDLVAEAREHASLRIVLRAYRPEEIDQFAGDVDVVVAGVETSWVTPGLIAGWRRKGLHVIGIHPVGDLPGAELLSIGGVDECLADSTPVASLVQSIQFVAASLERPVPEQLGRSVVVVGNRGGPGATEVSLAVAHNEGRRRSTVIIDGDVAGPALAVRLGVAPRPDVTDAVDSVRAGGIIEPDAFRRIHGIDVIVGSHRPGEPLLSDHHLEDVMDAALAQWDTVVVDAGLVSAESTLVKRADEAIIVADGTATGLVRLAQLVAGWAGPPPVIVANRVGRGDGAQVTEAVREWTGLEPSAVVPWRRSIHTAARTARPPDRRLCAQLAGIR